MTVAKIRQFSFLIVVSGLVLVVFRVTPTVFVRVIEHTGPDFWRPYLDVPLVERAFSLRRAEQARRYAIKRAEHSCGDVTVSSIWEQPVTYELYNNRDCGMRTDDGFVVTFEDCPAVEVPCKTGPAATECPSDEFVVVACCLVY